MTDSPDPPADADSKFLASITFLTGEDPNLGSFLLVVGIVTCVFIALFQFTIPAPVSHLLTGGVLFVTVLSGIFASLLDTLGYFDGERPDAPGTTDEPADAARAWVPAGGASAPLPPMLNFDETLRAYADMYDGDLPAQFDPFIEDYLRLKTTTTNRATIASDLRADLNPIGVLFEEGSEGYRLYEDVSERLFRYIGGGPGLTLGRVAFYDDQGNETVVGDLENQLGRVELDVDNQGEATDVEITVEFFDADGGSVSSRTCPGGVVSPGATKTVDTDVFVPSNAERATTTVRTSGAGTDAGRPRSG